MAREVTNLPQHLVRRARGDDMTDGSNSAPTLVLVTWSEPDHTWSGRLMRGSDRVDEPITGRRPEETSELSLRFSAEAEALRQRPPRDRI